MGPTLAPAGCSYQLDDTFRIVDVDDNWSLFAQANGAPELAAPAAIGQSAVSCVSDAASRLLYHRLFEHVLASGRSVTFPIRCDSPTVRRFLTISIERHGDAGLSVASTLVRSETRSFVRAIERRQGSSDEMMRMCGWCKAVDVDGRWCEIEEAITELRLFERELPPSVTHGMCPSCHQKMSDLLESHGTK